MSGRLAPVVVFAYNRPDHLRKVLESLQQNPEAASSVLYVYCDGAKAGADEKTISNIDSVRKIAAEQHWCGEVHVIVARENKGLAASVISGVDEVLAKHGKAIVMEDDLISSPHLLRYMNDALDAYERDERVVCITGYTYPVKQQLPETFFLRGADCWSWATWKRGWDVFEKDGTKLLQELERTQQTHAFDFNGTYPYTQMLRDQVEGKNSSWAIRWYASAFLRNLFTLYPGQALVQNIGIDGSGTHSGISDQWQVQLAQKRTVVDTIPVEDNGQARKAFSEFFTEMRKTPFSVRMKNAIWSRLPGFIRKAWSGKSDTEVYGWHGDYPDWNAAKAASGGYDSTVIYDKVFAAAKEVKEGRAAFERDGIIFEKPEFPEQTLAALQSVVDANEGRLRIIDFGGGPGSAYFLYRKLLKNVSSIEWHVVEQGYYYERGNAELANDELKFFATPQHAQLELQPDVLLLSSVLQYIEHPKQVLSSLLTPEVSTIIIETTPFVNDTREHITVQRVPPHIYEASYPCRLLVEKTFLSWFHGFEVQERYRTDVVAPRLINGKQTEWLGFVLRRKTTLK